MIKQQGDNDCGRALLVSLGYPAYELNPPDEAISLGDIVLITGGEDVTEIALEEGYRYDIPHIVLGIKKSTGNPHWFLRVENTVIDSELGNAFPAEAYMQENIDLVWCVVRVPFKPQ